MNKIYNIIKGFIRNTPLLARRGAGGEVTIKCFIPNTPLFARREARGEATIKCFIRNTPLLARRGAGGEVFYALAFLLLSLSTQAQPPNWQWAKSGGSFASGGSSSNDDKVIDMATDNNNNVYVLAEYYGDIVATLNDSALKYMNGTNVVLFSYRCDGSLRWIKSFYQKYGIRAAALTTDKLGNVYAALLNVSSVQAIGDKKNFIDTDTSFYTNKNNIIVKYDTSGRLQKIMSIEPDTIRFTSPFNSNYVFVIYDIRCDEINNLYVIAKLGKGLLPGGKVSSQVGEYNLKYNPKGELVKLTKLDMENRFATLKTSTIIDTSGTLIMNFYRDLSPLGTEFLNLSGTRVYNSNNLIYFTANGSVKWYISGSKGHTLQSLFNRPLYDKITHQIYVSGGVSTAFDTMNNILFTSPSPTLSNPKKAFVMVFDTVGTVKNYCYSYDGVGSANAIVKKDNNDTVFVAGDYAFTRFLWGNKHVRVGGGDIDLFFAGINMATKDVFLLDSLKSNAGFRNEEISSMVMDTKNNIYIGGAIGDKLLLGTQSITSNGGNSDFFIAKYGTTNCSSILPIKLYGFIATAQEQDVLLSWQSASEINAKEYAIERSSNAKDFATIATQKAIGNNSGKSAYTYLDNNAFYNNPNTLFYRLKLIDNDGYTSFSDIKRVTNYQTTQQKIVVYPNPIVGGVATIECAIKQPTSYSVFDILGNKIANGQLKSNKQTIDCSMLKKGIYLLKLATGEKAQMLVL
jgi:hypothetical protein